MALPKFIIKAKEDEQLFTQVGFNKKQNAVAFFGSLAIVIIMVLPICLLFISLFMLYSQIMPFYWFLNVIISATLPTLFATVYVISLAILKNNAHRDLENYEQQLKNVNLKRIFVKEFLNPLLWLINIATIVVINFIV